MNSSHFAGWDARTLALAIDEVTQGLPHQEQAQLREKVDAKDLEALELALAEIHLASLETIEAPPVELLARLRTRAGNHLGHAIVADAPRRAAQRQSVKWSLRELTGWLVAAGLILAFAVRQFASQRQDSASARASMLANEAGSVVADWSAGPDPLGANLGGNVVWSTSKQEGYMRFRSLPANDPKRNQYQLWIFDSAREDWESQPVDGGVFDVGPGEEVVVAISPKLEVRKPAMFAITLERPGGVVVSKRDHLVALAKL